MKSIFSIALVSLVSLVGAVQVRNNWGVEVRYDNVYDNPNGQFETVACSNGENGLITRKGWTHFNQVPTFPYIGGADAVSWNSSTCGSCWQLNYNGNSINITAIDNAGFGFNIAQTALDALTNGHAVEFGVIWAKAYQVDSSICGL